VRDNTSIYLPKRIGASFHNNYRRKRLTEDSKGRQHSRNTPLSENSNEENLRSSGPKRRHNCREGNGKAK
jgi:hypothetical protein